MFPGARFFRPSGSVHTDAFSVSCIRIKSARYPAMLIAFYPQLTFAFETLGFRPSTQDAEPPFSIVLVWTEGENEEKVRFQTTLTNAV